MVLFHSYVCLPKGKPTEKPTGCSFSTLVTDSISALASETWLLLGDWANWEKIGFFWKKLGKLAKTGNTWEKTGKQIAKNGNKLQTAGNNWGK